MQEDIGMVNHVLIIAEAGVNHNGNIQIAKKLIDAAYEAGADIVKFQTFKSEKLVTQNAKKAKYQSENLKSEDDSQLVMLKKLELSYNDHLVLLDYCKERKIEFLSTPFDFDSIDMLEKFNIGMWKIPSGEITNYPYLVRLAKTKKPIILSTGMCVLEEVRQAVDLIKRNGNSNITLLHCNTQYPTPFCDVNLKAMETLEKEFNLPVGYSDHTPGLEVPIAAVALGATVIEKHFTLDKNMEGPDHKASLDTQELKAMVKSIRNIEQALGIREKVPSASEQANITIVRKSIVAKRDIIKGEVFTEENLTTKRPGNGISPMRWNEILGKVAKQNFSKDELIKI
jgi:N,N'-diacetyllegionaminate synthase